MTASVFPPQPRPPWTLQFAGGKSLASGLRTPPQCPPSYLNSQVAFSGRPSGYPESISVPAPGPPAPISSVLLQLQFLVLILSSQPACTMKTDVLSSSLSQLQGLAWCSVHGRHLITAAGGREGQILLACPPLHGLADSEAKGVLGFPSSACPPGRVSTCTLLGLL